MGRIEEGEIKNTCKDKKTERDMVDRKEVLLVLRQKRDNLLEDMRREREAMVKEKSLYIRAGFIDAIRSVKKVKGEWK